MSSQMSEDPMLSEIRILDEPELEFRYGQPVTDPRDGLSLFGPYDADAPGHPSALSYGVIGTDEGIDLFSAWSSAMIRSWTDAPNNRHRLWPPYPGFQAAFACEWRNEPVWKHVLDSHELSDVAHRYDHHERVYSTVNEYLSAFQDLQKLDERVSVMVCVVPDEIYQTCRIKSHVSLKQSTGEAVSKKRRDSRKEGQLEFFSNYEPEQYELSLDFRRQIKARTMTHDVPIQIIRESTLRLNDEKRFGLRELTPLSNRMWNLSSALYYKGGGKPWKLATAREGVCYVGLAFRRADATYTKGGPKTAACAAQMFLDDGDGVVFLGDYGPWYSPEDNQYRLTSQAAHDLLKGALDTYAQLHGKTLTEVFLHSRSDISTEEFEGYRSAAPDGLKVVGIRVRPYRDGPRLYRPDKRWPVIRGTLWKHSPTRGYLFGSGFKPRLGTYDGWETPVPLQIDIQHGDADIVDVANDILGLTKLNYNACNAGDTQPVTVKFSDAVGEILVSNPTVTDRRPTFRFYI